ncbi:type VII secretion system-associated protein [Saccharopolyspora sp. NPDC000359]|uniref:type VII secretion system-associated protein n=1 Tax=Saccharopolyspora sp. NPDC000359 TaxID=3154251 RepID=UPI003321C1A0
MSMPDDGRPEVPPITPAMREEARLRAGGYIYVIDSAYDPNGDVPAHAIKGAFAVDENGEIGDYQANPNYRPSQIELGEPPASMTDQGMRAAMAGRLGQDELLGLVARAVLPVLVTPEGHVMLLNSENGPCLVAYTTRSVVPGDVHVEVLYLPRILRNLPPDVSVVLNGSAGLQARFPVGELVTALRGRQLLVENSDGGLEVGPPAWRRQSARLAQLVDETTFAAVEQALAEWGGLSTDVSPRQAVVTDLSITAVEVLLRGGIADPDVLAAAAAFHGVDPMFAAMRTKVTTFPDDGAVVAKLLRSATSPEPPEGARKALVFSVYLEHLRAMPWQVRAIVLANRIAEITSPDIPEKRRENKKYELATSLLSCASDMPEAFKAQVAEVAGVDPTALDQAHPKSELRSAVVSREQAVDRVRAAVGELGSPLNVDDIGLAYVVHTTDRGYFVHKLWDVVTSEQSIEEYRAKYDVFPFELGEQHREANRPAAPQNPIDPRERFVGSMLAGAVGDALGYAIEFHDIGTIRRDHGDAGLTAPVLRDGVAQISDDTQMMLFTLEGLIRAHVARRMNPVDNDPVPEVQHAYQRWFHTQGHPWHEVGGPYARQLQQPDGWLITNRGLFQQRGPGRTCISALRTFAQTHQHPTPQHRVNDSKGCGGVMRAAPVAVWSNDPAEVFYAAVGTAALTHGHPSGFLSAGVLAVIVHQLIRDVSLPDSVRLARDLLLRWRGHEEQLRALDNAVELARRGPVSPEEIESTLGRGAVGEEALAIGLYAVQATDNLRDALLLSVNHSGDSDSTGIVAGNIGGALYGTRAIPQEWLNTLELRQVIETLANDALAEFSPGPPNDQAWLQRYPAW